MPRKDHLPSYKMKSEDDDISIGRSASATANEKRGKSKSNKSQDLYGEHSKNCSRNSDSLTPSHCGTHWHYRSSLTVFLKTCTSAPTTHMCLQRRKCGWISTTQLSSYRFTYVVGSVILGLETRAPIKAVGVKAIRWLNRFKEY